MAHSGRKRPRDLFPGTRELDAAEPPAGDRVFRLTDDERQQIAACLRVIDEARRQVELQHDAENRRIVRDLRVSADRIYEILNELEEAPQETDS